jgi:hypothetical protein
MEERDTGGAPRCGRGCKVLDASQELDAPVAQRGTEHSISGKEDGFQIAGVEGAGGWIV